MKIALTVLLLSALSFTAAAQQSLSPDSAEGRSFVGVGLGTTAYDVMGKPKYLVINGIVPILTVHYGYRLSKRATLQAGLGYGRNELSGSYIYRYLAADSIYDGAHWQKVQAVAIPITLKFTPFNPYRRLQLYANASIVPVLGHIKARATETFNGEFSAVLYDEQMRSLTVIATTGLTLNYRFGKRLDGYIDGLFWYRNMDFHRSRHFIESMSVGIGLNYRL